MRIKDCIMLIIYNSTPKRVEFTTYIANPTLRKGLLLFLSFGQIILEGLNNNSYWRNLWIIKWINSELGKGSSLDSNYYRKFRWE